jgi:DNA ligase 1
VPKKLLAEAPVILMAYDLLEQGARTCAPPPFRHRRARLEALLAPLPAALPLRLARSPPFATGRRWPPRAPAPATDGAEGLMLKRRASPYHAGANAATGGNGSSTR